MRRVQGLGAAAVALLFVAAGCNKGPVPIRGVVTLDGNPLPRCQVDLHPTAPNGRPAYGVTDEQGRFTLTTLKEGDGALRGDYNVTFQLLGEGLSAEDRERLSKMTDARERMMESHRLVQKNKRKESLHANYTSPLNASKTLTVPPSGEVRFELKSDGS